MFIVICLFVRTSALKMYEKLYGIPVQVISFMNGSGNSESKV